MRSSSDGSGSQIARKDSRFLAFMRVAACDPTEFALQKRYFAPRLTVSALLLYLPISTPDVADACEVSSAPSKKTCA
jgi:hypothetical protein